MPAGFPPSSSTEPGATGTDGGRRVIAPSPPIAGLRTEHPGPVTAVVAAGHATTPAEGKAAVVTLTVKLTKAELSQINVWLIEPGGTETWLAAQLTLTPGVNDQHVLTFGVPNGWGWEWTQAKGAGASAEALTNLLA